MKVRVLESKHIEVRGKMKTVRVGQIADVGKGIARKWIREGSAELVLERVLSSSPSPKKHPKHKYHPTYIDPESLLPHSELLLAVRQFWFNNVPGTYDLAGYPVTHQQIQTYGGPNPEFNRCEKCQTMEWQSRLKQQNLHQEHDCPTSAKCKSYCSKQGKEEWTHYHQCFWFAAFCDVELNAPRVAMVHHPKGKRYIWSHHCDHSTHIFLRQFAQACQFDVLTEDDEIKVNFYDFIFVTCDYHLVNFQGLLGVPLLMYGHDMWKRHEERQMVIELHRPEFFWTPYYSSWKAHYKFPDETQVRFRPMPSSQFFTRVELDDSRKTLDILSIGCRNSVIYRPRALLSDQIKTLGFDYRIGMSHQCGARSAEWSGENVTSQMNFANAFSRELSTARYVAFDGIWEKPQPVFPKFFEVMGAGAIPIMPEAPDLELVGVKAWEHYIPVAEIRADNARLARFLDNYEDYKHIAENAVRWHKENADKLLFDGFEDLVGEITDNKYPRRLVCGSA